MNRSIFMEAAILITGLIIATLIIAFYNLDLRTSALFFIDGDWPIGKEFPWKTLYRADRYPAIGLAFLGLVIFIANAWRPGRQQRTRQGAFLVLLLLLGPGLFVNVIFKDHWGRPRPREVTEFSGKKQFLQPWQRGIDGQGRSFPSGHASAAFYMISPYFIHRRKNRRLAYSWLAAGITFGILMSIARISQGGHFLSDNLWAFGFVYLCSLLLCAVLKPDITARPATFHQP
jgi:lipid A 4'-phosphatase